MVTSSHEAMHRLFQEDPAVFARAFDRLGIPFPHPVQTSLLSPDLTEMRPLERRLDTLLQIEAADGSSYLLAIESQGKKDPRKLGSWAYYASYLYSKYNKPPVLLVVCQDESTARWAETPFHIGLPYWRTVTVRPLALGPHSGRTSWPSTSLSSAPRPRRSCARRAAEGRAEGRAEDVLFVLRARGIEVTDAVRERVVGCTDPDVLQGWLGRALTVERAQEIFG